MSVELIGGEAKAVAAASGGGGEEETVGAFPVVTSDMSPKLQDFLRVAKPFEVKPHPSLEEFKEMREGYRLSMQEFSDTIRAEICESVEEKVLAGVRVLDVLPKGVPADTECVILYIHGGGFCVGKPDHLFPVFAKVAQEAGARVIAIDYGLSPEHPFPSALKECVAVYKHMVSEGHKIALFGDSAGGNLCISMTFTLREEGTPLPVGIGLNSPWVDLSRRGDTFYTLEGKSPTLDYTMSLVAGVKAYIGAQDPTKLPQEINVLNGDFSDFPPMEIHSGTRDALLSQCVLIQRKSGASLELWEGCGHCFQQEDLDEASESRKKMGGFLKRSFQ